ncbi:hypothetical protein [Shimia sediminis]|uniref:hypothetical protein n=1 Tax=Shimia sediminis TaxID=2497945 RepID=UPI000F8C4231|nr:hypothetical protein [Shimia sediminis]
MSDNWILIVPKRPKHIPSPDSAKAALDLLERSMPDADEIDIVQSEHVQFFDCGANLETITCPRCSANIDFCWWGETMSADYDEMLGFQLNEYRLPCCSTSASLNELIYAFHQAFGRFALSAMNPNIGKMSDDAVSKIEAVLDCNVSVVYQHI